MVLVPPARLERWVANLTARHGETTLAVRDGALVGEAADGSTFRARLSPLCDASSYAGPATPTALAAAAVPPAQWGVLLVRKGGFAVARMAGEEMVDSKVGQRHVQGRSKAGGQSQQRFARRRAQQARVAFEAAADHAARVLGPVRRVVTGGDHRAVEEALGDSRLAGLQVVDRWLAVPDPRRHVLEQAVDDALAVSIEVVNA